LCHAAEEETMVDILKFILNETANKTDPEGHMFGLDEWNPNIARQRAQDAGIELTPKHWEVIGFLRTRYKDQGPVAHARELTQALEVHFETDGGRRFLYRLFPQGPVRQASRIAGLPVPADAVDQSFGSVR
jgi:tRNA 2-thiouridine synthesizing protein E